MQNFTNYKLPILASSKVMDSINVEMIFYLVKCAYNKSSELLNKHIKIDYIQAFNIEYEKLHNEKIKYCIENIQYTSNYEFILKDGKLFNGCIWIIDDGHYIKVVMSDEY